MSSDGGGLLLREVDKRIGLTERLARCFVDYRNPSSVEHDVRTLLAQRVYALALGYEDLNDHDELRRDALLSLAAGKVDPTGAGRVRERDRGAALASSSTLNRLELGDPAQAAVHRYKRIVAQPEALDDLLVGLFVGSHGKPPREIWLDLDATDDPLHGMHRWWSSNERFRARVRAVAQDYPEKWREFVAKTSRCEPLGDLEDNGIAVGLSRLVYFLGEVGENELAKRCAMEMVEVFRDEVSQQPLAAPEWAR